MISNLGQHLFVVAFCWVNYHCANVNDIQACASSCIMIVISVVLVESHFISLIVASLPASIMASLASF